MAKKKSELEHDRNQHEETMRQVRAAHQEGRYQDATELAVQAWQHIDGMMQFERRYEERSEYHSITSIAYVLKHAPLLFDLNSLERLSELLKSRRRIDKNTDVDLVSELEEATSLLWDAHRLWNHLEQEGEARQDEFRQQLGGSQDRWRSISESWEQIGFVRRVPQRGSYVVAIETRLDETIRGKCPSCGVTGKATKMRLLDQITCPKCSAQVYFAWMAT